MEFNGVVHACIVKQLTCLDIVNPSRILTPKLSKSKQQWRCTKIIKIGDKEAPPKPPKVDCVQKRSHNISHIVDSDQNISTFEPSGSTSVNLN